MRLNYLTKICLIWGLFWGALSFTIYFLGLLGLWYRPVLILTGVLSLLILLWWLSQKHGWEESKKFFRRAFKILSKNWLLIAILIVFLGIIILNLIGAIAPEKDFDALWYHLTIPKIYLFDHRVHFIPGDLFYYSVMPRLAEMLYGLTLSFVPSGIFAKLLHFGFGVMWALFSFQILRLFFSRTLSALLTLILYSLLIVAQLSGTAYIDLIVSFYAAGAIWGFLEYLRTKKKPYLYLMALFLGFNLAAKIYGAMITAVLGLVLVFRVLMKQARAQELVSAALIVLAIPFVYYLNAYLATGNPIYPVFSIRDSAYELWIRGAANYHEWLWRVWLLKLPALFWAMVVSKFAPVFGLIFLLPLTRLKKNPLILPVLVTFLLFFIFWSLHPVWEPRYLMVILPLMAVLVGWVLVELKSKVFWGLAGLLILVSLSYNVYFSVRHFEFPLKLASGQMSKAQYIDQEIGRVWYNFYDLEGFWAKTLRPGERLLAVNFHNLFYAPTGFVDWSTIEKEKFSSAAELSAQLKQKGIKYVALNKMSLTEWSGLSQEDLDQYFTLVWHNEERQYFVVK